eukprot:2586515-Rhodomonas_salina.1
MFWRLSSGRQIVSVLHSFISRFAVSRQLQAVWGRLLRARRLNAGPRIGVLLLAVGGQGLASPSSSPQHSPRPSSQSSARLALRARPALRGVCGWCP